MAAADAWILYNQTLEFVGDNGIDMDTDTFKMRLTLSTYTVDLTDQGIGDVANEHAAANGYTAGGETITTDTWSSTGDVVTFDFDDVTWTASGGSIIARFAHVYSDTSTAPVADLIIGSSLLDSAPADVTATTGNQLTVQINANGMWANDASP